MPLNVRKFYASFLLILLLTIATLAQTTGDVMRDRISKAKAHIVVKNYSAAIYELENIQRETSDPALNSVVNVLLMHCYLEQTDYGHAQEFLAKFYKDMKSGRPNATENYYLVAGQIVKGARTQLERYRGIGLNIADRNLPLEALVDVDKMRETLEVVVTQTKELGADKKQSDKAIPLMEEAMNARVLLAKDEYDANRWKRDVAEARENLVDSRSTVINATDGKPIIEPGATVAGNTTPKIIDTTAENTNTTTKTPETNTAFNPVSQNNTPNTRSPNPVKTPETPKENNEPDQTNNSVADNNKSAKPKRERIVIGNKPTEEEKKKEEPKPAETVAENGTDDNTKSADNNLPMEVGSLVEYATKRVNPIYPQTAKTLGQRGIVKVEFMVGEDGKVSEIGSTSGPSLLRNAATDALKKWQFKPFMRDGVPVRAVGFVNFNFNL